VGFVAVNLKNYLQMRWVWYDFISHFFINPNDDEALLILSWVEDCKFKIRL
jgi:hypothetical protein